MHKSSFETQSKLFTLLLLLTFMLFYALIKWKSIFFVCVRVCVCLFAIKTYK